MGEKASVPSKFLCLLILDDFRVISPVEVYQVAPQNFGALVLPG